MSRDPYATPLTPHPLSYTPTSKVTAERLEMMNFGGEHWLSKEERKLMLHVVVLREKAIAFCEAETRISQALVWPSLCHPGGR